MELLDKLKEKLDRAGKAAQGAFDEGKTRIEAFRTRQQADRAAQALGYAVFRAKHGGSEVDDETYTRLAATLATHDAEASRYEAELETRRTEAASRRSSSSPADSSASATQSSPTASSSVPPADVSNSSSAQDVSG